MRAKTILTVLFLVSIGVAAFAILHALPQRVDPEAQTSEILVAAVPLASRMPAERREQPLAGARSNRRVRPPERALVRPARLFTDGREIRL